MLLQRLTVLLLESGDLLLEGVVLILEGGVVVAAVGRGSHGSGVLVFPVANGLIYFGIRTGVGIVVDVSSITYKLVSCVWYAMSTQVDILFGLRWRIGVGLWAQLWGGLLRHDTRINVDSEH